MTAKNLKSKLACISSLFICFNSKKKKQQQRNKNEKKNSSVKRVSIVDKKQQRPISPPIINHCCSSTSGKSSVYFETEEGTDDQWQETIEEEEDVKHEIDGQFFFTAKDDPAIPMEVFEGIHMYPPLPTTQTDPGLKSPVRLTKMETLLYSYQHPNDDETKEDEQKLQRMKEETELAALALEHQAKRLMSIDNKQHANDIFNSTNLLLEELKRGAPDVKVSEKGFPGALTDKELEAVERLWSELKSRDPIYNEIVRSLSVVEKEAYSLCRWLRARKFDVDAVFELLDEAKPHYIEAKKHDFYPNLEESLGFSRAVFLSQYPEVFCGSARNGCPVMYMKLGGIQPEGIKCLVSIKDADKFFWNGMKHCYPGCIEEGRRVNPNFVRTENMTIYDLEGVSRSQVTSDTLEMIKVGGRVMTAFPETLHCLVIINAPSWFGLVWSGVRKFIDPRTASKIEVFTNSKRGIARMRELIDNSQIPSDYGGTGPSLAEAASGVSAAGSSTNHHASAPQSVNSSKVVVLNKVMYLKNHQEKSKKFEVKENQTMTVTIYTRCKKGAKASIFREGSDCPVLEKDLVGQEEDEPYSVCIGDVKGLGNFEVRLKSVQGPGTFLILGTM